MRLALNFLSNLDFRPMYKVDDIHNWLSPGSDFDLNTGILLFNYFSKTTFDKKIHPNVPERIRLANLKYELGKILRQQKQAVVKEAVKEIALEAEPNSAEEHKELIDASNLPFELQKKWIKKGQMYKQIGELRKNLFSDSKETRALAAQQIVALTKENRKIWNEINFYQQHGHEMVPDDDKSVDIDISQLSTNDLIRLSKNLPSWICKEKKKIAVEVDPRKKKLREKDLMLNENKLKAVLKILSEL